MKKGIVYKTTGSWYIVKDELAKFWNCRIKGKLKIDEEISSTNPIVVGDTVIFEQEEEKNNLGTIIDFKPRKNYMVRISPRNVHQQHIIAANIDLAVIVTSIISPRTSLGFIDRFLITAEAYHIPAVIVVNKIDLLNKKETTFFDLWSNIYPKIGYPILPLVAKDGNTIGTLQQYLEGKVSLFSGHSGVGKSTLIQQLLPGSSIKTNELSNWSGKGQHTTTFSEMFDLPTNGMIIDTPGIKEFGLIDVSKEELAHFFPEMRKTLTNCKFNNCLHINEPGCAVKKAVYDKLISEERYLSYYSILESLEKKW